MIFRARRDRARAISILVPVAVPIPMQSAILLRCAHSRRWCIWLVTRQLVLVYALRESQVVREGEEVEGEAEGDRPLDDC